MQKSPPDPHPRAVGALWYGFDDADFLFNQCEGPAGRHRDLSIVPNDRDAERLLVLAPPIGPGSKPKPRNGPKRWIARRRGTWDAVWTDHAWDVLARDPRDIISLVYEPPEQFTDAWWEVANRRAALNFGPDPRAHRPVRLPTMWTLDDPLALLRSTTPPPPADRPLPLVAITSGTRHLPGHKQRIAFLERLAAEGLPLSAFGRRLPATLQPGGPVRSKGNILRAARYAVVVETSAEGDLYVSEKLWDAILCGCVPLYFGSRAADIMIPSDAFIRLPDLGNAGVQAVRDAVHREPAQRTIDAMNEARAEILGPLRLVEWLAAVLDDRPIHPALRPDSETTPAGAPAPAPPGSVPS